MVLNELPPSLIRKLTRQQYHLVGRHSAVKPCNWLRESLVRNRQCYKNLFYGIASHRCVQCTAAVVFCSQRCVFCWRMMPGEAGIDWNQLAFDSWDEPKFIVDGLLKEQQRLVIGYGGNPVVSKQKFEEAQKPKHFALSLSGENTIYPFLPELIKEIHGRGMTTFLVTNGTNPQALERLADEGALPMQLYVSLCAADEATYRKTNAPLIKDGWKKLNETLELFASLKTRRVVRLTLCKNLNLKDASGYARLIEKTGAEFVEPKAYMPVGFSRERLGPAFQPTHDEIMSFARELAAESGYVLAGEQKTSRVALLCRDAGAEKNRLIKR
ncbi:MAG: 4-demethylwyosine synthase TYW1 [Candidatus Micrarchaeota archaeon]